MSNIHITSCPVCRSRNIKKIIDCKDYFASGESFAIEICNDCGFRFTQDFPDEINIGRYYETKDYISHSNTKKGIVNSLYHSARKKMLSVKCDLVCKESGLKHGNILDYGCGTGYFLESMKTAGWQTVGIEKNSGARGFACSRFGLNVLEPEAGTKLQSSSFDVITLWHVLEHLEDLDGSIESFKRLLKSNGTLIVAVPNANSYDASHYKQNWAAYDVPRHLWHFTPDSLNTLLKRHKFEIKSMHPMPLDAFYVSMLSEKNMGHSFSFIRGLYRGTIAFINSLGTYKWSSSIIYVIKPML